MPRETKAIATKANKRLAEQQLHNTLAIKDKVIRTLGEVSVYPHGLIMYLKIQDERLEAKETTENIVKQKITSVKAMHESNVKAIFAT
ncbi:hypothetical protein H0I68_13535 [Yersinia kristensenii]|uniref:hypothetical protein n=1 Tax=Yersinia kristensenii TaxID=28152 RepID=UPI001C60E141|nr:hypothetical protein [Yersinia kristensenii]MBW5826072.1 hypothetical protein [Yersinia kristensenii]